MIEESSEDWIQGDTEEVEEELEFPIEYNLSSSPNDFNIKTLNDFILSGVIKIPTFQRNYVWDIKRASKLIESIIMGLPIPQLFFYEQSKNNFEVIDGQQRLMTIYYFIKKRFPRMDKRSELRKVFDSEGKIPDNLLYTKEYFEDFNLKLPSQLPNQHNRLSGLNYSTLDEEDKSTFELRTIRSVIIKQHEPKVDDGNSCVFEIFARLNTGGMNLKPQEIRTSLYHSNFYKRIYKLNLDPRWRRLTNREQPDLHMQDIEIILRGFAMLIKGNEYKPSMTRFLNKFSEGMKNWSDDRINYLESIFNEFLEQSRGWSDNCFISQKGKFNMLMYESAFAAICSEAYDNNHINIFEVTTEELETLKNNPDFITATSQHTTNTTKVKDRLRIAKQILLN